MSPFNFTLTNNKLRTITLNIILVCLYFCSLNVAAQNNVQATFRENELEIIQGEMLSNVACISNPTNQPVDVKVTFDYPQGWRKIGAELAEYQIPAFDSIFIPLRLIPQELMGGSSRYMVNVNVLNASGRFITDATFWAFTIKKTSWKTTILEGNKLYLKNGTDELRFRLNILNTGAEKQPISLTIGNKSLYSEVRDSFGNLTTNKSYLFNLGHMVDTSLTFVFKYTSAKKNQQIADIENYRPINNNEEKTFNIIASTDEPNLGQGNAFSNNQRIIIKKLSDKSSYSNQTYSHIPVIVDFNVSNLLDNVSFTGLNIRGNGQVSNRAQLIFNVQSNATTDRLGEAIDNTNYYLAYFHERGNVQAGFVNGGVMGVQTFGRGVKAAYNLTRKHTIGGFYVTNSNQRMKNFLTAKGVSYQFAYLRNNRVLIEYAEADNEATGFYTRSLNLRSGINFLKTQTISFNVSNNWNERRSSGASLQGFFYLVNYGGSFFKNKINMNHTFGSSTPNYSNLKTLRTFYNHRTQFVINQQWNITMVNNYDYTKTSFPFVAEVIAYNNMLAFVRTNKVQSVQFAGLYNRFIFANGSNDIKGANFNYTTFNPKTFFRFSSNIEAGVATPTLLGVERANQPYLLFNSILFYKTFTSNVRYNIGAVGAIPALSINGVVQQTINANFSHQYVFANPRFILQNGMSYFYGNQFKRHTINLFPEILYFTPNAWRFRFGINYNLQSGVALANAYSNAFVSDETPRMTTQGMFINLGIRKEFNAPIPLKKQTYSNAQFVAFFDINGNGIMDKNEKPFENVVIRIGENELLTNEEGEALLTGAPNGPQRVVILALDQVDGWFANVKDSLILAGNKINYIPFVKSVKIKGKVGIRRDQVNYDANDPFDLSLIKITAKGEGKVYETLTSLDGSFELYLPFGTYTIAFDEQVLGEKFMLTRNDYKVEVTKDTDGLVIQFQIIEKTRKVNRKVFGQPTK